jgi:hypothetical protein
MLRRACALAGLLITALGTTCATILRARQDVRPAPPLACLRAALAASPDVIEVVRDIRGRGAQGEGFWVAVRDSTAAGGRRLGNLLRGPPDRAGYRAGLLEMSFHWPGFKRPPAAEEAATAAIADRVLTHLHARCARDAPPPAVCDRGDDKWKPCAPAG